MSTPDPYAEIRGKRLSELTPEQRDLANEMWLRQNYSSFGHYHWGHEDALFPSVLRYIDSLRAQIASMDAPQPKPVAWASPNEEGGIAMLFIDRAEAALYCADGEESIPLYAAPPQRVPLTDEQAAFDAWFASFADVGADFAWAAWQARAALDAPKGK